MIWPVVKLGDHCEILSGFAFASGKFNTDGTGLPLIRIRDVVPAKSSTYYDGEYDTRYLIENGALLIGMDGDFNRERWAGGRALLNQRVCRVIGRDRLDDDYLFHLLPDVLKVISDRTPFVTVKHLSAKDLREFEIPLPPLPEQKRIAAILDQADALRRLRAAALEKVNTLGQAIFQEMFIGKATDLVPLSQLLREVQIGPFGASLHKSDYVEGGIPLINPMHISDGILYPDRNYSITIDKFRELERYSLREGDVIMGRRGEMGRSALVLKEHLPAICGTGSMILRANPARISPGFLAFFLGTPAAKAGLEAAASGVTMLNLNSSSLDAVKAPGSPLTTQMKFAAVKEHIEQQKLRLRSALAAASTLFASLQHRAFRGEL